MKGKAQRDVFLGGEADQWFERNRSVLNPERDDIVVAALEYLGARPKRILEIGCANGWRLERLRTLFHAECAGIEPSDTAVEEGRGRFAELELSVGTADSLGHQAGAFDLVIFGFCFYLVDPALHFKVVAEADRVLADGGMLAIFDFLPPTPYYNDYAHKPGMRAHKLDFSRYFLAHPGFTLVHRALDIAKGDITDPDRREGVDVLIKSMPHAFHANPFR